MAVLFDSLYSLLVNCLLLGAIGVGGLGTLLYLFQRSLIYAANVPTNAREVVDTPDRYGMDFYEHLTLQTKDHVSIRAFFIQTSLKQMRKTAPTVLYCHVCMNLHFILIYLSASHRQMLEIWCVLRMRKHCWHVGRDTVWPPLESLSSNFTATCWFSRIAAMDWARVVQAKTAWTWMLR